MLDQVENELKLGVIGGLGPMATAYFMELIISMTDAPRDQDHLEMIIYNCPSIPDRTSYILGKSHETPLEPMIRIGKKLAGQGARYISIPCITAHYFYKELVDQINVPIIHGIKETVGHLKENGIKKVGILATDGTIVTGLFQKELDSLGIDFAVPSKGSQQKIMDIIYKNIKAGLPVNISDFSYVSEELRKSGGEAIILGCTELSLIKRDYPIGPGYIDVMEVLAKESIIRCEKALKDQYKCLISS